MSLVRDKADFLASVGARVYAVRAHNGLSMDALAEMANVGVTVVWRMEKGRNVRFWEASCVLRVVREMRGIPNMKEDAVSD